MPLKNNVNDLRKDKLVMWQDKWVHLIALIVGFLIPMALGYWYNGASGMLGAFILTGVFRTFVVLNCTFFINSLCHTIGSRPYNSGNSARDSAIMAFFTCGEGYHNYHHAFQHDYRNGVKPWQFDPTKWMIWTLSKVGLTSNLRRVADEKILLAEMREAKRLLEQKRGKVETHDETSPIRERAEEILEGLSKRLADCFHDIEAKVSDQVEVSKAALSEMRREIRKIVRSIGKFKPVAA